MNKGFTLLEVLIAIAVLSISMLGIYRLSFVSLSTTDYAQRKAYLDDAAYQRVLEILNYPDKLTRPEMKMPDGTEIKFTTKSGASLYSQVNEITLTAEAGDAKAVYYYYESQ